MSDDWDHVTIIRKHPASGPGVSRSDAAVNAARRSGETVTTEKKYGAATNKHAGTTLNAAKLDRETEELKHKTVGMDVGRIISSTRLEKKWTQKELAQQINELATTVSEYESGRAIPNQNILSKLERALGVRLRGEKKGEKFGPPGPKKDAASAAK